ncbi:IQ and ubiquitin-like domain-containing protein [Varanus komodoensis]|nr:IQ and ubiquitin-like domain-containing protein [Varanus komodoensis]
MIVKMSTISFKKMADPEKEANDLAEADAKNEVIEDTSVTTQAEANTHSVGVTAEHTDIAQLHETTPLTEQNQDRDLATRDSDATEELTEGLSTAEQPVQEPETAEERVQELGTTAELAATAELAQGPAIVEDLVGDLATAKEPVRELDAGEELKSDMELAEEPTSDKEPHTESQDEFPETQKDISDVQDLGAEVTPTTVKTGVPGITISKDVSEEHTDFAVDMNVAETMLMEVLESEKAHFSESTKDATVTVKFMLHPDIQIFTMAFNINRTVEQIKKYFATRLQMPLNVLQFMLLGRIVDNSETLWNLGAQPNGTIQVDMFSLDEETFPIKAAKLLHEFYMADVITVRVQKDAETFQDIDVEIKRPSFKKPFLGGFRHKHTGTEYHNAGSQTDPKKRLDKEYEEFCRSTQTVVERKRLQQTRNTTSTQMTKIGVYVTNVTDKLIEPKRYVTAEEYHARRLKAIIVIQTYYRRWLAKEVVKKLKEQLRLRLEWEEQEELRKQRERAEKLLREYNRRMNPRTKDDFELLYHALELWRQEELERINSTFTGAERKAALCGLLEKEAQLIASIGRHKINADEENQEKAVLFFLEKVSAIISFRIRNVPRVQNLN